MSAEEDCQPKTSDRLRTMLGEDHRILFTLIQKFRYDKRKKFPVLSERNDIIVFIDEAHRTQYKSLAETLGRFANANIWHLPAHRFLVAKTYKQMVWRDRQ